MFMKTMAFLAFFLCVPGFLAAPVRAQDAAVAGMPFIAELEAAYPHYRMAWFYTRTGSGDVAVLELDAFMRQWQAIVARYRDKPPATFAQDTDWRRSLDAISAALEKASRESEAGQLRAAHTALDPVRRTLGSLRARSGIVTFSDLVEAGAPIVRELSSRARGMKAIEPSALLELMALAEKLKQVITRVRDNAPAGYARDPSFQAAIAGNFRAIGLLERGIASKSTRAIVGSIAAVRSDYNLLFIRYG